MECSSHRLKIQNIKFLFYFMTNLIKIKSTNNHKFNSEYYWRIFGTKFKTRHLASQSKEKYRRTT